MTQAPDLTPLRNAINAELDGKDRVVATVICDAFEFLFCELGRNTKALETLAEKAGPAAGETFRFDALGPR